MPTLMWVAFWSCWIGAATCWQEAALPLPVRVKRADPRDPQRDPPAA
jgi:hypothetical protein